MRILPVTFIMLYSTFRATKSIDYGNNVTTLHHTKSLVSGSLKSTTKLPAVNLSIANTSESSTLRMGISVKMKEAPTFPNTFTCDEAVLHRQIFKDYNINVRPVFNFNDPVIVTLGLALRKIQHIDEINQSFKAIVNLLLYWKDKNLVWDRTKYPGISSIEFPFDKNIWTPDIMIYNALRKPGELGIKDTSVRLYNNGQIFVWTQTNIETACEIKTKKYPFDVQTCKIIFGKFISSDDKVMIKPLSEKFDMTEYVNVADWQILENKVMTNVLPYNISSDILAGKTAVETLNYTMITYTLQMQRSCRLCFHNAIIPVLILAVLNLLTFFVPCESGEKTSYSISIFLTLAVFLTVITHSLPESIDGVSYLSSYVTFQLVISAVTLCCAVISLHIHYKKRNTKIPSKILRILHMFRNRRNSDAMEEKQTEAEGDCLDIRRQQSTDYTFKCRKEKETLDISYVFDILIFTFLCVCELIATIIFIFHLLM